MYSRSRALGDPTGFEALKRSENNLQPTACVTQFVLSLSLSLSLSLALLLRLSTGDPSHLIPGILVHAFLRSASMALERLISRLALSAFGFFVAKGSAAMAQHSFIAPMNPHPDPPRNEDPVL